MADASESLDSTLLISYIEKIANTHNSLQELQREINRLRQDARADGFNMEAVHQLGQILAKSPHDKGVGLLTEMLQYARRRGIVLDVIRVEQGDTGPVRNEDRKRGSFDVSHFSESPRFVRERVSLLAELVLGVAVAGSLIWLLR